MMKTKKFLPVLLAAFFIFFLAVEDSFARAGRSGGGSFGSRGSRTYSAPVREAPARQQTTQQQSSAPQQQSMAPPRAGGLFSGLAGGLAGGIIGGLLFSSLGHAAMAPGAAGGLGILDIVLIGAGIFLIMRFFKRRKQSTDEFLGGRKAANLSEPGGLDEGLGDIRRMDGYFDEEHFMTEAIDLFFNVQGAFGAGDIDRLRSAVAPRAFETLKAQVEELRDRGLVNRIEGLAIKDAAITEAWQEKGTDYITLKFTASAVDYLEDQAGNVAEGSKTEATQFTEYWTFAREIGKDWKLSAIQQAS